MNNEWKAIERTPFVVTVDSLVEDFRRLGIRPGMTLLVHSSLSAIGWVNGGPVAVVQALMAAVTEDGTLVMPTHSGEYSDPSKWQNPPVPEAWWGTIRATMPAFDPAVAPTRGMGRIVEAFRTFPGVIRSSHPALSFAAWGKLAHQVTDAHGLDYGLGEKSPLARIYELDGSVLLIGVGHDSNTSLHLAENRAAGRTQRTEYAPILENGERVWKAFQEIQFQTELFEEIGRALESDRPVVTGAVGVAECRLFRQRDAVDFAVAWLDREGRMDSL